MPKPKVLVVGAGGHAAACIDIIEEENKYKIIGLIGKPSEIGQKHSGYEVIGTDEDLKQLLKLTDKIILGVGQIKSPSLRIEITNKFVNNGFKFQSTVSPSSRVSKNTNIGIGSVIMHNTTISTGSVIGDYSIINTGAIIEHDSKIGSFTHISTGVILNGNTSIGNNTFVGSGTIVKEQINIGHNCIVGMGQQVRHDLSDNTKFIGN
jgi:sugar O-acyltransferase (sialic acid O-acetyltransferase NeuD family)